MKVHFSTTYSLLILASYIITPSLSAPVSSATIALDDGSEAGIISQEISKDAPIGVLGEEPHNPILTSYDLLPRQAPTINSRSDGTLHEVARGEDPLLSAIRRHDGGSDKAHDSDEPDSSKSESLTDRVNSVSFGGSSSTPTGPLFSQSGSLDQRERERQLINGGSDLPRLKQALTLQSSKNAEDGAERRRLRPFEGTVIPNHFQGHEFGYKARALYEGVLGNKARVGKVLD